MGRSAADKAGAAAFKASKKEQKADPAISACNRRGDVSATRVQTAEGLQGGQVHSRPVLQLQKHQHGAEGRPCHHCLQQMGKGSIQGMQRISKLARWASLLLRSMRQRTYESHQRLQQRVFRAMLKLHCAASFRCFGP